MGNVYDLNGNFVGTVNAWGGKVFNAAGKKAGEINIFNGKVVDDWNFLVGKAYADGDVFGVKETLICKVAFFGTKVHDPNGNFLGDVQSAGAPDPMPDMQCRGAAALLLLCSEIQKEDIEKAKSEWNERDKAQAKKWAEEQRLKREKKRR